METQNKTPDLLPNPKMTTIQKSMVVNVGLSLMLLASLFVLPPIGDPTPLELKFIEVGYLEQEVKATQGAWWQQEIDQQDYNVQADENQVELSKKAEDLRDQLENLKTNEIPAYVNEDDTGLVPTADAYSQAGETEDFR